MQITGAIVGDATQSTSRSGLLLKTERRGLYTSALYVLLALFAVLIVTTDATGSATGPYFSRRVLELDDESFDKQVSRPNVITAVVFYSRISCPQCREVRDAVNRAAQDLYGQVTFAAVDIKSPDTENTAKTMKITSSAQVPELRIFPSKKRFELLESNGFKLPPNSEADQGDVIPFKFPLLVADVKTAVTNPISERADVAHISGRDIIKFLRGEPLTAASKKGPSTKVNKKKIAKVVLVSTKQDIPTVWQAMGLAFRERVRVGFVQKSDRAAMRKLPENTQAPAIYLYPAPGADSKDKGDEIDPVLFSGSVKAHFIRSFIEPHALDLSTELNDPNLMITDDDIGIPKLEDDTCFDAHCRSLGGLCAILVTPWDQPKRDTTSQLATLAAVQESRTDTIVHFSYLQDRNEPALLKLMQMSPEPYSQLIILDPRSKKYAKFVGSFRADDVASWIGDVVRGTVAVRTIQPPADLAEASVNDPKSWQIKLEAPGNKCEGIAERVRQKEERRVAALKAEQDRLKAQSNDQNATKAFESTILPSADDDPWVKHIRPQGRPGSINAVDDRMFERNVVNRNTPIMVRFVPGAEKDEKQADAFRSAGTAINGMVKYYTVSCVPETKEISTDRILNTYLNPKTSEPCGGQILVFPSQTSLDIKGREQGKKLARDRDYHLYDGEVTKEALMKYSLDLVKDGTVRMLDEASFQPWLVENILMPRLVIVSDKREPSQLAKSIALEFEGYVDIGVVHSSERNLMQQLQVDRAPAVRILKNKLVPKPDKPDTMELNVEMVKFVDAALYFNAIAQMLDEIAITRFASGPPSAKPRNATPTQFPPRTGQPGSNINSDTATNPAYLNQGGDKESSSKLTPDEIAQIEAEVLKHKSTPAEKVKAKEEL